MPYARHSRARVASLHVRGGARRPARSLLTLLLATSALTLTLHGIALADGGAGGGLGGGAGGTGYTGASGSNAAQSGMYLHGGGGGGAAGGGAGGTGGPGVNGHGLGGSGGAGGLNNQNGGPLGDADDGAIGGVSGQASGGGSGGGGGAGGAGFYYTSNQDLDLDSAPSMIVGGKGGAGGKGYPQGGAGGKGGDGGGGVVMETGDSVIVSVAGVTGGDGGKGGDGANAGDPGVAGRGGNGGAGVVVSGGGNVTVYPTPPYPVPVLIIGGKGGDGGNGNSGSQARGGDGGVGGAAIEAAGGGDILIANGGLEGGEGGAGGNGGSGAVAGAGGAGGVAIDATGAKSVTIGATSAVVGGYGGAGGTGAAAGVGGVGIVASGGITVTVAGSVSGGLSSDTVPVQADAIDLFGGGNTLTLESGYSFTGHVVSDGTGAGDTLRFGGTVDGTFNVSQLGSAREFRGFSALDVDAASTTWTLTGSNDFSGPTTITKGTLAFDAAGLADSAVTVGIDGTISAAGASSVKSLDVSGAATLTTNTTTLTAASGVTFESGSTFNVAVDSTGNASKIDTGAGATVLYGGSVVITAGSGSYSASTQYVIVTGASVGGEFDGAEMASGSAFLVPTLHYDIVTEVYLTFATDFGSAANTRNRQGVSGALDAWGLGGPLGAYLLDLDPDQAHAAFDALSGDAYASLQTALLGDSHIVRDAMEDRLLAPTGNGKNLWAKAFGNWDSHDGDGNAAGFSSQTSGILFGADGMLGDWRLGALAGYGRGALSVPDRDASAGIDGYHAGLYAGTSLGDLQFRSGAGFTRQQIAMARTVAFGDFNDTLSGNYGADLTQGFAELGYKLGAGHTSIEPFANVAGVALHTDGFSERGGDAALTVGAADADVTLTTLGVHASTGFKFGTLVGTASATAGWQHAFGSTPHDTMAFESADAFDVAGVPLAIDAVIVKASLALPLAPAATFGFTYGGQFASGVVDQSANADFNVQF